MDIIAPESGTALILNAFPPYSPRSHIHRGGIGFGGSSRLMERPSTWTLLWACTIGIECWSLDTVLAEIFVRTILVGSVISS